MNGCCNKVNVQNLLLQAFALIVYSHQNYSTGAKIVAYNKLHNNRYNFSPMNKKNNITLHEVIILEIYLIKINFKSIWLSSNRIKEI